MRPCTMKWTIFWVILPIQISIEEMKVGLVNVVFFRSSRKNVDLDFTFFGERILIDSGIAGFWNTWFSVSEAFCVVRARDVEKLSRSGSFLSVRDWNRIVLWPFFIWPQTKKKKRECCVEAKICLKKLDLGLLSGTQTCWFQRVPTKRKEVKA